MHTNGISIPFALSERPGTLRAYPKLVPTIRSSIPRTVVIKISQVTPMCNRDDSLFWEAPRNASILHTPMGFDAALILNFSRSQNFKGRQKKTEVSSLCLWCSWWDGSSRECKSQVSSLAWLHFKPLLVIFFFSKFESRHTLFDHLLIHARKNKFNLLVEEFDIQMRHTTNNFKRLQWWTYFKKKNHVIKLDLTLV